MQTFKINFVNVTTNETRELQVEADSVELAHKDGYFHHAVRYEEIVSITNATGEVMYTEEGGFTTMPQQPPGPPPTEQPDSAGSFERFSEKVNW